MFKWPPRSSQYKRLSSPSHSFDQPLLLYKDYDHDYDDHQCMEQLKLEVQANQRKAESLEKKNTVLEKDFRELRAAVSKLESRVPSAMEKKVGSMEKEICELKSSISALESRVPSMMKKNVASLEKEIRELKSSMSKLQLKSNPVTQGSSGTQSDVALKKEVDKLACRMLQLELDSLMNIRKQDVEKIEEKISELENRRSLLTIPSFGKAHLVTPMKRGPEIQDLQTNDLVILFLIFLVGMFIGVAL